MDKRTILFILLSVVIWFLYIQFVAPRFEPQKPAPAEATETSGAPAAASGAESFASDAQTSRPSREMAPGAFRHPAGLVRRQIALENSHVAITLANQGASIESLVLKQYQSAKLSLSAKTSGLLSLINAAAPDKYALSVLLAETDEPLESALWDVVTETASSVVFRYTAAHGLVIHKIFSLDKYNYAVDFSVRVENISGVPITATLLIKAAETISPESHNASDIVGLYAYTDPPVTGGMDYSAVKWHSEELAPAKVKKEMEKQKKTSFRLVRGQDNVYWAGLANKYFAAILVPLTVGDINLYGFKAVNCPALPDTSEPYCNLGFYAQTNELTLAPQSARQLDFIFYVGPKKSDELAVFSKFGFDKLLSYGWFGFISKLLLFILGGLFGLFKNYGTAIIALTVIVKLIMFPITKKGQVSMYHLQKLQPRIKALQAQYKNDKRRFGEEQLKLFKEFGVNPLSGCLPMLLQIPVFIGLYWALAQAIELRQSPFMLWITDLSQPDQLCKLPFPVLGAHYLHVLPLIMTVSWLIQSLTQPKSPDPQARQQQKMFLFMPLVFGIMFYSVPSGLTLYWFTSTLLGIGEQILIKKYYFR
jgi:YidC/Oxa1 family membrane protein insertase